MARTSTGTITGIHTSLTSSRSRRARVGTRTIHAQQRSTESRRTPEIRTPLVRASAPHDVSGKPEATWAQPLSREELS
jgi:hypothetical protein